jgi:GNAT superfamily N-acetyltransferase
VNAILQAALPEDADPIRALVGFIVARTFIDDPALQQDTIANVNLNIDRWLAQPELCVHVKAVAGGEIVGMVLVREFWNLCNLFVHPQWQRKGIGRALLEAGCAPCKGRSPKGAILLNAAPNAVGFYARLGFVEREPTRPLPPGAKAMLRRV